MGMPCFFMASRSLIWFRRMADQETRTPAAVRSTSHQKTVMAPFERLMKLRNMKAVKKSTHT
jgi:hypothetical protein